MRTRVSRPCSSPLPTASRATVRAGAGPARTRQVRLRLPSSLQRRRRGLHHQAQHDHRPRIQRVPLPDSRDPIGQMHHPDQSGQQRCLPLQRRERDLYCDNDPYRRRHERRSRYVQPDCVLEERRPLQRNRQNQPFGRRHRHPQRKVSRVARPRAVPGAARRVREQLDTDRLGPVFTAALLVACGIRAARGTPP
jgi:hypothetical protein